ncbi:MAG: gamma-glutamylcyclotransferase family protein [Candidatus Nanohaloarchaea archaeon]
MNEGGERGDSKVLAIGYGSNIADPSEVDDPSSGTPVKVHKYKRHIQLPASYRAVLEELGSGAEWHRGVFDVDRTDDDSDVINGVLYQLSEEEAEKLDQREAQYGVDEIDPGDIEPYVSDEDVSSMIREADRIIIYNSDNPREEGQEPHPRYLAEVLQGAHEWDRRLSEEGEMKPSFTQDLLETSEVDRGQTLGDYLESRENEDKVLRYVVRPEDVGEDEWNEWTLGNLTSYGGEVESEEDPWLQLRKWRNAILDWEPATDEELGAELRYMTRENQEKALRAMEGDFEDPEGSEADDAG